MSSFLSTIKIVGVVLATCVLLILVLFTKDILYNQIHLAFLEIGTKKYSHPPDSQLMQKISIIGNFAATSNQCGFLVAEARTTALKPEDIHKFYTLILIDLTDKNPPYHKVSLYILKDKKDREIIEHSYTEAYHQIPQTVLNNTNAYLLITSKTGYPPNNDLRCH